MSYSELEKLQKKLLNGQPAVQGGGSETPRIVAHLEMPVDRYLQGLQTETVQQFYHCVCAEMKRRGLSL